MSGQAILPSRRATALQRAGFRVLIAALSSWGRQKTKSSAPQCGLHKQPICVKTAVSTPREPRRRWLGLMTARRGDTADVPLGFPFGGDAGGVSQAILRSSRSRLPGTIEALCHSTAIVGRCRNDRKYHLSSKPRCPRQAVFTGRVRGQVRARRRYGFKAVHALRALVRRTGPADGGKNAVAIHPHHHRGFSFREIVTPTFSQFGDRGRRSSPARERWSPTSASSLSAASQLASPIL